MSNFELIAEKRERSRKSSKKAIRSREVVGVIYNKKLNIPIKLKRQEFDRVFNKVNSNSIIDLKILGETYPVFIKDLSFFPRNQLVEHVDFYAIPSKGDISIKIPIEWVGLPIGIAKGGIIRRFSDKLFVLCSAEKIPQSIKVDISDLDINMGLYLRDLSLAEGIKALESLDKAIVSVVRTSKTKSAEEAKATEKDKKDADSKDEKSKDAKETESAKKK